MASWSRSFRDNPQLSQFYLKEVTSTGRTLGVGSYGSVVEIKYEETICAAKQIHDLLLQTGNEGLHEIIEKYLRECQLMAGLRHPNITQFLGLCVLEGFQLPLLVMERLEMSVDDLLECSPNIPLPVKISILTDTSSGLVYLHSRTPPIVHRDLTARNVLLTASLTAKITDLGNSRMVTSRPGHLAQTLTKTPGTTVYMPPEALSESHRYGPSLDVFSFGHLALFTLTQMFPGELLSSTYPNPSNPDQLIARSEVNRRQTYMSTLETTCVASHPVLLDLVQQCLHNTPERRPSSQDLLTRLRAVKSEVEGAYGGSVVKQLNIASVLYVKEIREKDKKIQELQVSEEKLIADNSELVATIERMANDIKRLENESRIQHLTLEQDNREKQMEIERLESQLHFLQNEVTKLKTNLKEKNKVNLISNEDETFPLQFDWRRGPDMPEAMTGHLQSVQINGIVYVGGGMADTFEYEYVVMTFNTQTCKWNILPPYTTRWFAMTTINCKLVLVGGETRDDCDCGELGEWQPDSNQFKHPFPSMPTPRWGASTISYKHWLVVAGGCHRGNLHSGVEILDVSTKQWSIGPPTPTPWAKLKSTMLGDTWYLMGGWCKGVSYGPDVYSVSLEALVSHSALDSSKIWRKLPSVNCRNSCPVIVGGSLLAVGGQDIKSKKTVSTIQCYVPETNTWVQAGLLPHAVWSCVCIITSDKLHIIGGYDGETKCKELFTSAY